MSKIHPHAEKYLWLWGGVGVIMAVLLGLWIYTLPQRINFEKKTGTEELLWEKNSQELNQLWQDNSATVEKIQQFAKLYRGALTTIISSSSTATAMNTAAISLTPEQIQNIKQELESQKNP